VALRESKHAEDIIHLATEIPVFGICGGYQIMGKKIIDEDFRESKYGTVEGLGLLDITTKFGIVDKIVTQSLGKVNATGMFNGLNGDIVKGYELHEGVSFIGKSTPLLSVMNGCGNQCNSGFDGAVNGLTAGTYFHGIFHNFHFRRFFTDYLRSSKGLKKLGFINDDFEEMKRFSIDKLADIFIENIDMEILDSKIDKK
jgi:adenosylcobyric acid synthase